uniref:uncharacterized protein LOC101602955 n=1 Tax=Jaculus jaculus TaxID=51337 RepID=UPI001E1B3E34|nr:uncharacterized protein LOC101602955 [Jaculus jaculus]
MLEGSQQSNFQTPNSDPENCPSVNYSPVSELQKEGRSSNMATSLHGDRRSKLPSPLSRCPPKSFHQQDVLDLDRSPEKASGQKCAGQHAHTEKCGHKRADTEDREKRAEQSPLEQPASPRPAAPARPKVYLIVGLQNELTKHGALKSMSDYEDFWKLIQEEVLGTEMKEKLQKIKCKMMNPRAFAVPRRKEVRLRVGTAQDNGLHQGTQVVQLGHPKGFAQTLVLGLGELEEEEKGRNKITDKTKEKNSRSQIYLRRLYQMYSTSLANREFSRRLLERDGRFADMHTERRAGGLLDYMIPDGHPQPPEAPPSVVGAGRGDCELTAQQSQAPPALCFLKHESTASPRGASHPRTGPRGTLCEHVKGKPGPAVEATAPGLIAPLTLEHVAQTHHVVEAKTASRYWVNYVDEQ